jgi:hypothetical protein
VHLEVNKTFDVARLAQTLVVHFPSVEDMALAELIGGETGDEIDKFERCQWRPFDDGITAVLTDIGRWFAGAVLDRIDPATTWASWSSRWPPSAATTRARSSASKQCGGWSPATRLSPARAGRAG